MSNTNMEETDYKKEEYRRYTTHIAEMIYVASFANSCLMPDDQNLSKRTVRAFAAAEAFVAELKKRELGLP